MTRSQVVLLIALVSAVAAALADAHPTGTVAVDVLLTAGFGAVGALAASRARRWTWLWGAAITAAFATAAVPLGLAAAAAVLGVLTIELRFRRRYVGALAGTLIAQAVLRLPTDVAAGVPTLVAMAAVIPVLLSGYAHGGRGRRWARRAVLAASMMLLAGVASLGTLVLMARLDGYRAVEQARLALGSLGEADEAGVRAQLADSSERFRAVQERADAWWAAPARIVPIVAQQRAAISRLAGSGAELTEAAGDATAVADIEAIRSSAGHIDVEAIAALEDPADRSLAALRAAIATTASVDSPWLVSPLADRADRYRGVLGDALEPARVTREAVRVVPDLLGRSAPRTYLVLFANPAESRDAGGFLGAVGLLHADGGQLSFGGVERIASVSAALVGAEPTLPDGLPAPVLAQRPEMFAQNWTGSAHFPTVAAVVQGLWPQIRPEALDGVLYVDPHAFAGLLELTGPIAVPGLDRPLESNGVLDFLLRGQYLQFAGGEDTRREDVLADLAEVTFSTLTSGDLPGPRSLADLLGPAVRGRHLLLWTFDDGPHRLLSALGLDGRLELPERDDLLHITAANTRSNKLDPYVTRTVDHAVQIDDAGQFDATTTITLTSSVIVDELNDFITGTGDEDDGLAQGTHRINLSVHTPWPLAAISIDGVSTGASTERHDGLYQHTAVVSVPEGGTTTVELRLVGAIEPDGPYELVLVPYAGSAPDQLSVTISRRDRPGPGIPPTAHVDTLRLQG